MNVQQDALAGGANAQQTLNRQVNLFLFDLNNEAVEHGFKPDDSWALQLVTDAEIVSLKRLHHPIVSIKLRPDVLLNAFQQIKTKLQQSLSKQELDLTVNDLMRDDIQQLAAYPNLKTR